MTDKEKLDKKIFLLRKMRLDVKKIKVERIKRDQQEKPKK